MTVRPPDPTCEQLADDLAAVAVGAATGHDRARVLHHLETCPRCVADLDRLTATGDRLVELVPELDPPPGFADRTVERIRRDESPASPRGDDRVRRVRPPTGSRRIVAAVAASLVLLAGAAVGDLVATSPSRSGPAAAVAHLHSSIGATGTVLVVDRAGAAGTGSWLAMTVEVPAGPSTVRCDVTLAGGSTRVVGHFWLTGGYASWVVPVPAPVTAVRSVRLLAPGGAVVATTHLG